MTDGPRRSVVDCLARQAEQEQGPEEAEGPAADDVGGPVDSEHHPGGADREDQPDRGPHRPGPGAGADGEEQGHRQEDDGGVGGMGAWEAGDAAAGQKRIELDEVAEILGPDADELPLHDLDDEASAGGGGEQDYGLDPAAGDEQVERSSAGHRDEEAAVAELGQRSGVAGELRVAAGIADEQQRPIEVEAAEQKHHRKGGGEADQDEIEQVRGPGIEWLWRGNVSGSAAVSARVRLR